MNRVPPDYHISPVGTHAGDRINKKTVPGAFEVPRKLYGNLSLLGSIPGPRPLCRTSPPRREALQAEELEPMTGKMQVKKSWQLAEQHGLWWAYEGDFRVFSRQTHDRSRDFFDNIDPLGLSRVFDGQ